MNNQEIANEMRDLIKSFHKHGTKTLEVKIEDDLFIFHYVGMSKKLAEDIRNDLSLVKIFKSIVVTRWNGNGFAVQAVKA